MDFVDYQKADIPTKLKFWIELPKGSSLPNDWQPNMNDWDVHIRSLCQEALKEIEFLRRISGGLSQGKDFADYKREANRPDDAF